MNIGFIAIAWIPAFDALEFVTPKYALSDFAPIPFDCSRQAHLASFTDSWISSPAAMTHNVFGGRPPTLGLDYRTGQKKGSAWPG
jgi:hypothetical protein